MTKPDFTYAFLIYQLVLIALRAVIRLFALAKAVYPRTVPWSRADDVAYILIAFGWILVLLWALS